MLTKAQIGQVVVGIGTDLKNLETAGSIPVGGATALLPVLVKYWLDNQNANY